MTRILISLAFLLLTILGYSQHTENRKISGFSGIQVSRSVEVVFTQSSNFSVKVETDLAENLPKITTIVDGETLIVSIDNQYKSVSIGGTWKRITNNSLYLKKAIVYVSAPKLSFIKCSSSGSFKMTNELKATDLMIEVSSSGDISGNIEAKNVFISASSSGDFKGQIITNYLEAKGSSSGDINITGSANKTDVTVSSSSDFKGKGFKTKVASLKASSSGDITIEVTENVKASASSSGSIYIHGKPSIVDKKTSSSGSINQI